MASAQSLPAKYTRGLTGYTRVHGVAGEIEKIYFQGSNSTLYWQVCFRRAHGRMYLHAHHHSQTYLLPNFQSCNYNVIA